MFGNVSGRLESSLSPLAAIRAFFDEIIRRSMTDRERRGCMLVNSALEMAPHDQEFRKAIANELACIEDFFRRCVDAGQRDGTTSRSQPPEQLAKMLLTVLLGIRVLARTRPHQELLEGAASAALAFLGTKAHADVVARGHDNDLPSGSPMSRQPPTGVTIET